MLGIYDTNEGNVFYFCFAQAVLHSAQGWRAPSIVHDMDGRSGANGKHLYLNRSLQAVVSRC